MDEFGDISNILLAILTAFETLCDIVSLLISVVERVVYGILMLGRHIRCQNIYCVGDQGDRPSTIILEFINGACLLILPSHSSRITLARLCKGCGVGILT